MTAVTVTAEFSDQLSVILYRECAEMKHTQQEENFHWNLKFVISLISDSLIEFRLSLDFYKSFNGSLHNRNPKIKIRLFVIP